MAKHTQGIQIALIIFVLISVSLGVTTYLFQKQTDEIIRAREDATAKEAAAQIEIGALNDEIAELKQMIGYPDSVLSKLTENFQKDMKEAAPGQQEDVGPAPIMVPPVPGADGEAVEPIVEPDAERKLHVTVTYISVIEGFRNKMRALCDEIAKLDRDKNDLAVKYKTRESSKDKVIAEANEKSRKAVARKEALDAENKKILTDRNAGLENNFAKMESTIKTLDKDVKKSKDKVEEVQLITDEKQKEINLLQDAYDKTLREPQDNPQGKIVYVNPNGTMGIINLGKADGVTRGLSFSVYDPRDMSENGKKGSIEVISSTDQRRAEVRIFNEDENYPIGIDDVIYSPSWSPGFKEHFALLGVMDIEGDGRNDLEIVRSLVLRNGGLIDAYQNEDGSQEGRITQGTTYVIRGKSPESIIEGRDQEDEAVQLVLTNYTNMVNAIKRYNTKEIPLKEYLQKIGYQPQSEKQNKAFLSGGDGVERTSSGAVSGLYTDESTYKSVKMREEDEKKKLEGNSPSGGNN